MKVVINSCFGGYSLSHKAMMRYAELSGFKLYPYIAKDPRNWQNKVYIPYGERNLEAILDLIYYFKKPLENGEWKDTDKHFCDDDILRNDPILIRVVEELGEEANGDCAELKIVEIPDGVDFVIQEYDGNEHIAERHRTWG